MNVLVSPDMNMQQAFLAAPSWLWRPEACTVAFPSWYSWCGRRSWRPCSIHATSGPNLHLSEKLHPVVFPLPIDRTHRPSDESRSFCLPAENHRTRERSSRTAVRRPRNPSWLSARLDTDVGLGRETGTLHEERTDSRLGSFDEAIVMVSDDEPMRLELSS